MSSARCGSYAAGMVINASVTNLLTPAQPSAARPSVARIIGAFALRCLEASARGYVESAVYHPYWIGAGPLSTSCFNERVDAIYVDGHEMPQPRTERSHVAAPPKHNKLTQGES